MSPPTETIEAQVTVTATAAWSPIPVIVFTTGYFRPFRERAPDDALPPLVYFSPETLEALRRAQPKAPEIAYPEDDEDEQPVRPASRWPVVNAIDPADWPYPPEEDCRREWEELGDAKP